MEPSSIVKSSVRIEFNNSMSKSLQNEASFSSAYQNDASNISMLNSIQTNNHPLRYDPERLRTQKNSFINNRMKKYLYRSISKINSRNIKQEYFQNKLQENMNTSTNFDAHESVIRQIEIGVKNIKINESSLYKSSQQRILHQETIKKEIPFHKSKTIKKNYSKSVQNKHYLGSFSKQPLLLENNYKYPAQEAKLDSSIQMASISHCLNETDNQSQEFSHLKLKKRRSSRMQKIGDKIHDEVNRNLSFCNIKKEGGNQLPTSVAWSNVNDVVSWKPSSYYWNGFQNAHKRQQVSLKPVMIGLSSQDVNVIKRETPAIASRTKLHRIRVHQNQHKARLDESENANNISEEKCGDEAFPGLQDFEKNNVIINLKNDCLNLNNGSCSLIDRLKSIRGLPSRISQFSNQQNISNNRRGIVILKKPQ